MGSLLEASVSGTPAVAASEILHLDRRTSCLNSGFLLWVSLKLVKNVVVKCKYTTLACLLCRITKSLYAQDAIDLAPGLILCELVHESSAGITAGRLVEVRSLQ